MTRWWGDGKVVYSEKEGMKPQWVRVQAFMNKKFSANGICPICRTLSCRMVWLNIYTEEIKCTKCFSPFGW